MVSTNCTSTKHRKRKRVRRCKSKANEFSSQNVQVTRFYNFHWPQGLLAELFFSTAHTSYTTAKLPQVAAVDEKQLLNATITSPITKVLSLPTPQFHYQWRIIHSHTHTRHTPPGSQLQRRINTIHSPKNAANAKVSGEWEMATGSHNRDIQFRNARNRKYTDSNAVLLLLAGRTRAH